MLEAGKAVRVPNTVTALTVAVAPTDGYILSKAADGKPAKTVYKFAKKANAANGVEAIGKAMNVSVRTEVVALEGNPIFLEASIYPDDNGLVEGSLTVKTDDYVVPATVEDGFSEANASYFYKIKEGAATVEITVKAKEGYTLNKDNPLIHSVTEKEMEDGSIEYTVFLLAKKLGENVDYQRIARYRASSIVYTFTAKVEPAESDEFSIESFEYKPTGDGAKDIKADTAIPYGASLSASIRAEEGCSLTSVTYTMGGDPVTVPTQDSWGRYIADVSIDKVTADVTINVASRKNYNLATLTYADGNEVDIEKEDGVYRVRYDTTYRVGVKLGVRLLPAVNVRAVVKDAKGNVVPMVTPVVDGFYREINLADKPALYGQDIVVEMYVAGVEEKVGTYLLSVHKKTTKIEILDKDGNKIDNAALTVGSRVEYTIDTDGDLKAPDVSGADELIWLNPEIQDGKLVITMDAKDTAAITGKTAMITVEAEDNEGVKATVTVTAKPLFDESKAPTVTKTANGAADTEFCVDVVMDLGEDFQEPVIGSLWYEVTATAKDSTDESFPADKLKQTVTERFRRTGDSTRVKLEVANSNFLGAGAEWEYGVTAKLLYCDNPQGSGTPVATSAVSEPENCGTIAPLFTTALKLKKGSDKVALYTGRETESVIATIVWDDKKDKDEKFYKVVDENIQDDKTGLHFAVRDNDIVITHIDTGAELGKHTITVLATADQNPGHEMYASRATIAVTVVKGINQIIVTTPSTSIYKPAGTSKAATLKLGVDYNVGYHDSNPFASWDGKKWVTTPKVKKVTWEIVGADSDVWGNIYSAPKNIADYVTVKNGTVTVDKKFQVDPNYRSKNMFKVKVTAADYAGNETSAVLDYTIEITNEPTDISRLIIVNYTGNGAYEVEVKAVHDITDKKAVSISASDADGGYVYAMPATAAVKVGDTFDSLYVVETKLPVVSTNMIAFASGNKKVLTVNKNYNNGRAYININVLAAGKKAAVKVTTADGSNNKKTHTMNLTLDYKATAGNDLALGIQVRTADNGYDAAGMKDIFDPSKQENVALANTANVKTSPVTADFTATGAARLDVQLYVGDGADGSSETYSRPEDVRYTNYKLAVKGGKFVTNANGEATIITTSKETTLTLTDQSPEAKKARKAAYVYKLTNTAYAAEMAKAPKVTVKNTLYQWGTTDEQKAGMTVLDATKKPYAEGKFVKVEMDWSARTDKNEEILNDFASALKLSDTNANVVKLNDDGSMALKFKSNTMYQEENEFGNREQADANLVELTPGSYKLKVTVGTMAKDASYNDVFMAETLPATVTVKVVKAKAATFKLNATYTISEFDGAVILTGKSNLNAKAGETMAFYFKDLKNANVGGRVNHFTEYFEVDQDETSGTWRLVMTGDLKDALAEENATLETVLGKNGLTGYISYEANPNVSYYDSSKLNATDVKITVKPAKSGKTGSAYKANNAEVGLTKDKNKTQIDIVVNGEKVNVKYAAIDADPKKVSKEFEIDTDTSATGAKDGQVVLKVKQGAEIKDKKSYTVNLKIVPADSCYAAMIEETANKAAQTPEDQANVESLIQRYGIAVKASVKAVSDN